jgi:hypothetical protein
VARALELAAHAGPPLVVGLAQGAAQLGEAHVGLGDDPRQDPPETVRQAGGAGGVHEPGPVLEEAVEPVVCLRQVELAIWYQP